ncbi:MAG: hypothetical protein ACI8WT_003517 [Clostridium sp.]|jgi:hypothetical protein
MKSIYYTNAFQLVNEKNAFVIIDAFNFFDLS